MSLIPSESLSFPDSFRAAVGWRLAKGPSPPEHSHPELEAITAAPPAEHPTASGESVSTVIRREHVVLPQTRREEALSEETSMRDTEPVQLELVAPPEREIAQQTERPVSAGASASTTRELEQVVLPPTWQEEAPSPEPSPPADKTEPIQPQPIAAASGFETARKTEAKIPARIPIVPRKHVARILTESDSIPVVPRPKFRSLARTENSDPVGTTNEVKESVATNVPVPKESTAGDESQAIRTPPKSPVVKMPVRPGPFHAQIDLFPESERRGRWIRFIAGEIVALTALIVLLRIAWTQRFADRAIVALLLIMIGGAVAAVVTLPIIFARNNPARWVRDR
ncbi:MAG: hypothetical protein QOG67_2288 [Verrucomicrobiota bacterium]